MKFCAVLSLFAINQVIAKTKLFNEVPDWAKGYNYEDHFLDMEDQINVTAWAFGFNLTRAFSQGVLDGLYGDRKVQLDDACFSAYYVNKISELVYLWTNQDTGNFLTAIFPTLAVAY